MSKVRACCLVLGNSGEKKRPVKALGPARGVSVGAGEWRGSGGILHNHVQSSLVYCFWSLGKFTVDHFGRREDCVIYQQASCMQRWAILD